MKKYISLNISSLILSLLILVISNGILIMLVDSLTEEVNNLEKQIVESSKVNFDLNLQLEACKSE